MQVTAPCRVHFGLVGMARNSRRAYGGVGLAMWHSKVVVTATGVEDGRLEVTGGEPTLRSFVKSRLKESGLAGISMEIVEHPTCHVGLGSKTATLLACGEAALLALGRDHGDQELLKVAGRGGASGIGVNTYFAGGLIGDSGHGMSPGMDLMPSSRRRVDGTPSIVFRVEWPAEWYVSLVRPTRGCGLHDSEEAQFFSANTPVPRSECAQVAMALFFELPSAVMEGDFEGVIHALRRSRQVGFKSREMRTRPEVSRILAAWDESGEVAATMSSFGPSIVLVSRSLDAAQEACAQLPGNWIFSTGDAANRGRMVELSE
ncbi:beta-ribofuranosylaminobenzene 5'-phosphate synthase family protein [Microbispora bryophytorum]|uniref:beta-ribofuranosylaminobenzene 5'-phosphate synthase family protein n=1 Tax=Microbispora bryophytorum TaxID=1460882 RepID=UPI00295E8FA3|nr:beta-ribofuranosylaminobenzene 5'-phosphate synthase family protein [Microbispora camponoti]